MWTGRFSVPADSELCTNNQSLRVQLLACARPTDRSTPIDHRERMASKVPRRVLGTQALEVSAQGLGCMGMSRSYGPAKPEAEMIELIRHAVDSGITFFDTSDMYGLHANEILIGKAIQGIRDKVQIATKFGCVTIDADGNPQMSLVGTGHPEYVRKCCEGSLERLGVDYIDLYYQQRVDATVPIEITFGELKKLVEEGKVKYLGISEASAIDIRRAHAIHPITAVQIEWSLWSREVEEEIIPTCRELGIGIVPYSPLGRGFFSGVDVNDLSDGDFRKFAQPRFQGENFAKNRVLYDRLVEIGARKKLTAGQIALAWVQHQGEDVVPIPGTTKVNNLHENVDSLSVRLSKEELAEIEAAVPKESVAGGPWMEEMSKQWTHVSLPLSSWKQ